MLINPDFCEQQRLPPRPFMEQIMDNLMKVYCFLWDKKDTQYRIALSWKELSKFYNKNAFRSNVRKLNNEGLLSYDESKDGILIELVGWDEIAD